jgi:internalin A
MARLISRAEYDNAGNITALDLSGLQLTRLPPEISQLDRITSLNLSENHLTTLPAEIGQLASVRDLNLSDNRLTSLPAEIGRLSELRYLALWGNKLKSLPAQIGLLHNLQELDLSENQLTSVPPEIGRLINLQFLYLWQNRIKTLPPEIGRLKRLQALFVSQNQMRELPPSLAQLSALQDLDLSCNQITTLPLEVTQLGEMKSLSVEDNPLRTPPPEIAGRGLSDIVEYLHALSQGKETRYEAKLIMVGEGATGKTSLLRSLKGDAFVEGLATTHGIEVQPFSLNHPYRPGESITLNVWDFGGQQIYHTTHQFFMTKRSLYLLVWNARGDSEQARLDHWLAKIHVLAPGAPVMLVATHRDECRANLDYHRFKEAYPQLVGSHSVSNKDGTGVSELRTRIAEEAAKLPLMEQQWPSTWVAAETALRSNSNRYLSLAEYGECCAKKGVSKEIAETVLGGYLHDLGRILYFQDDDALSDFVVLKPNWLTRAISRVLDDIPTREAGGVLAHADFPRIWYRDADDEPYERRLYPLFLRLMERYLISFQLENLSADQRATHSLVPLLLPFDRPREMLPWEDVLPDQPEIKMVFRLVNFVPPGLMSWFIALTHRYTQGLHWREGVRLQYQEHQAEVVLNPSIRELWLRVRGPVPSNFFNILQHTLNDRIFRHFFEGIELKREVPCTCHREYGEITPCGFFHDYERLVERMTQGKRTAECGATFREVSVPLLLEGIHYSTDDRVAAKLEATQRALRQLVKGQDRIIQITSENRELLIQNSQLFEQLNRSFTRIWNLQMASLNAECPNTFIILPSRRTLFNPKALFSTEYTLHLLCQNPTRPHIVSGEKGYRVPQTKEWWANVAPWLNRLVDFLRYIPKGRDILRAYDDHFLEDINTSLDVFEAILKSLPDLKPVTDAERIGLSRSRFEPFAAEGPAFRALYKYLKKADQHEHWCGLHRTTTIDGNILWLCEEHQAMYRQF